MAMITALDNAACRVGNTDLLARAVGPKNSAAMAPLAFFTNSPYTDQMKQNDYFAGSIGGQLGRLFSMAQLPRDTCYFDYFCHTQIPYNKPDIITNQKGYKNPTAYAGLEERFKQTLQNTKATVVVLAGELPFLALYPGLNLYKYRGSPLSHPTYPGKTFIPMFPLAYTFPGSAPEHLFTSTFDLKKALRIMQCGAVTYNFQPTINPDFETCIRQFTTILDNPQLPVTVDIETDAYSISCIGLSVLSHLTPITVPFINQLGFRWTEHQEAELWRYLAMILESPRHRKVAQNGYFDFEKLYNLMGIKTRNFWFDTMLAQAICWADLPKGLDYQTSIYTDLPYYKDEGKDWKAIKDYNQHWLYNAKDILATGLCQLALEEELDSITGWSTLQLAMELHKPLLEMSIQGTPLDKDMIQIQCKKMEALALELLAQARAEIGIPDFSPDSPKQMQAYFYGTKGYEEKTNRKTGKTTCDADALKAFRTQGDKAADLILQYKKLQKLVSTYYHAPLHPDGRFHTQYKIAGTDSGRLSSGQSLDGYGTNVQNIPYKFRKVFVSDPNKVKVELDLSQAEARAVAYDSGDPAMILGFEKGYDVHTFNASNIFQIPYEELVERIHQGDQDAKDKRQLAKKIVHAQNYSMGPRTMAMFIGCSVAEAKRLGDAYHARYPGLRRWHGVLRKRIQSARILYNLFGRPKRYLGYIDDPLFRSAYSFIPQSTVAECLNRGLVNLANTEEFYKTYKGQLHNTVHDSVQTEIPIPGDRSIVQHLMEYMTFLQGIFQFPIQGTHGSFIIPCDFKIGFCWGSMVEVPTPTEPVITKAWRSVVSQNLPALT